MRNQSIGIHTDTYTIIIIPRTEHEPEQPVVFVNEEVTKAADPELAKLIEEEKNLGQRRWAIRVEHGGNDPEIDDLYDRLNDHAIDASCRIAREVLTHLASEFGWDTDTVLRGVRFSERAGCQTCPCSPGIVVPNMPTHNNQVIDVFVSPPMLTKH